MRLPGYVVAFVLAVLLSSTTPVGTGAGVHQFNLLHPLFGHIHVVDGRILTHEQMQASQPEAPGVNFGTGTANPAEEGGPGVSPTVPAPIDAHVVVAPWEWMLAEPLIPSGQTEAPPDPPPL